MQENVEQDEIQYEVVPPNQFVLGIHVKHTGELASMQEDIADFINGLGGGQVVIQVAVNAPASSQGLTSAIGFATEQEEEDYDDYEDSRTSKTPARRGRVTPIRKSR